MTSRRVHHVVALASMLLASSCSLSVSPEQVQCEVSADCAELGYPDMECTNSVCVGGNSFSCLETAWPSLSSEKVDAVVQARSLSVAAPVPGLTVKVCNTLIDSSCSSPTGQAITDAQGQAKLELFEGFRGHLLVPSASAEQAPYILHMNPPPNSADESTLRSSLTITNLSTIRDIAQLAQEPFVEARGHLFFTTRGCDGELLPGVRVTIVDAPDDMVVTYLGTNGFPDESLDNTGVYGAGAIINLQPGFVTVRGFHDEVGKIFEQVMLIAEDTITSSQIIPSTF